jgi:TRAP-type C4-dicarboxylate transport system permease small subunit
MLRRAYDGVVRALVFVAFSVMLGAALAGTVSRYLPFLPTIAWGEEVTRYAGIWSVFLVSGLGLRYGAHLGVDMLTSRLPTGARRLVYLLVYTLILAFVLLLLVAGLRLARENVVQLSPALEWSMGWVYLCIPIGAGLMLVEVLGLLGRALQGLPPPGPAADGGVE